MNHGGREARGAWPCRGKPRYLFHWTTRAKLEGLCSAAAGSDVLRFRAMNPGHVLAAEESPFHGRRALFAWSHPITGMAADGAEIYCGTNPCEARLLLLEMRSNLSLGLCSYSYETGRLVCSPERPIRRDLYFSTRDYEDGSKANEWVVLNPKAIANFTADPAVMKPFFKRELEKLRDASFQYPVETSHTYGAGCIKDGKEFHMNIFSMARARRDIVIPTLEALIRLEPEALAPSLRRSFVWDDRPTAPADCPQELPDDIVLRPSERAQ